MSRYCGHSIDTVLAAAERWKQRCLLQGTSVFTNASLWRPARFAELVVHFVEKPDESDKKFYQKLQLQLDPASAEAKRLAAELIWVLMLFPYGNPGPDTKRKNIRGTWGLSGDELPLNHELLATEVLNGIGSVGTAFNTHFWRECAYAINTFKRVLELDQAKRAELLADGWRFADWLAQQPMEGKRQFRHILLFLLFPDIFELSSSGRDKRSILQKIGAPLGLTADPEDAVATDRALSELRGTLAQKYDTEEIDFYRPPIVTQWRTEKAEVSGKQIPPETKATNDKKKDHEVTRRPLNLILYGPPGTGKTYQTKRLAVEVIDGRAALDRTELLERFEALRLENRVGFVTFHQSFSYEDFVEGLRPVLQDGQSALSGSIQSVSQDASNGSIQYECRDGLFKKMCAFAEEARTERPGAPIEVAERGVFKMSLGDTQDPDQAGIYDECIANHYVLLGWGEDVDFSGASTLHDVTAMLQARYPEVKPSDYAPKAVYYLKEVIKSGDLVVISDGNTRFRAIGMVNGDYRFLKRGDRSNYRQSRAVKWLRVFDESQPIDRIFEKRISQMTLYLMDPKSVKRDALQALLAPATESKHPQNYVLLIFT